MPSPSINAVAVITGASSGIGAVYADRLAKRGYDLILVARRIERLRNLKEVLSARYQINVQVIEADLTAENDLAQVEHVLRSDVRIAVLVNTAGQGKLSGHVVLSDAVTSSTIVLTIHAPIRNIVLFG